MFRGGGGSSARLCPLGYRQMKVNPLAGLACLPLHDHGLEVRGGKKTRLIFIAICMPILVLLWLHQGVRTAATSTPLLLLGFGFEV